MPYQFTNNATGTLAENFPTGDTTLLLVAGQGALFPTLISGQTCQLTVTATDGTTEIVTCTARVDDLFTVSRAQEGTAQATFATGSRVELRLTAAVARNWVQKTGDTMSGDLDLGGNDLTNAVVNLTEGRIDTLASGTITALDGNTDNHIEIPSGGSYPTLGDAAILTAHLLRNAIFMWSGTLPAWVKLCDGTNGTPDLRDRFILGAGGDHEADTTGGSWISDTELGGWHDHGAATAGHALTSSQVPALSTTSGNVESGNDTGRLTGVSYSGSGSAHTHGISSADTEHVHEVTVTPPYYALAFVMLDLP